MEQSGDSEDDVPLPELAGSVDIGSFWVSLYAYPMREGVFLSSVRRSPRHLRAAAKKQPSEALRRLSALR